MAQLDRLLSVMVSNHADALLIAEGDSARLEIGGTPRPITKGALTGAQVVALLREIAPVDATRKLEAGEPATFRYDSDDGAFLARAMLEGGKWAVSITLDDEGELAGRPAAAADADTPPIARPTPSRAQAPVDAAASAERAVEPSSVHAEPVVDPAMREELDALLQMMVERNSSDLHLRCDEPPIYRTHGEMTRLEGRDPLHNEQLEAMLLSIMPERNRKEFVELNDTDFAYEIPGLARFRANALRDRKGAGAVFRQIPATVVSVEQLGLPQELQNLCYLTKGLVLVTGPTGSGKSTTLCALIDLVNRVRTDHVITIEDPIEFVHQNKNCIITQRQVGVHTSSFKHALRAALREDPDIILVGELRDLETMSIAIETAETGHLVFGTLHTTTAAGTIDRIIDQFPADRQEQIRVMLSESLKGVIAQTLCKKVGGGRVAAREVLLSIPAVSNLIREGKTYQIQSVMQTSRRLGMVTLNDALIELVDAKQVDAKEAYMKSIDKQAFVNMLKAHNHDVSFVEGDLGGPAAAAGAPGSPAGARGAPAAASKPAASASKVAARR